MDAVAEPRFERGDEGKGNFNHYKYDLLPRNGRVRVRLAGSDPHQHTLREIVESGASPLETAISRRTGEQERVDAPIEVRLFTGSRVSPPVGYVPRGLESIVDEALSRLDKLGRKQRIPVAIVRKDGKFRVELLMGETR
jgi:hypothetical protein